MGMFSGIDVSEKSNGSFALIPTGRYTVTLESMQESTWTDKTTGAQKGTGKCYTMWLRFENNRLLPKPFYLKYAHEDNGDSLKRFSTALMDVGIPLVSDDPFFDVQEVDEKRYVVAIDGFKVGGRQFNVKVVETVNNQTNQPKNEAYIQRDREYSYDPKNADDVAQATELVAKFKSTKQAVPAGTDAPKAKKSFGA